MARPKTVSCKTLTRKWGNGWNPPVKLVYINRAGRRQWQVTRLSAAIYNAKAAASADASAIEITYRHNGYEYIVTGWE